MNIITLKGQNNIVIPKHFLDKITFHLGIVILFYPDSQVIDSLIYMNLFTSYLILANLFLLLLLSIYLPLALGVMP